MSLKDSMNRANPNTISDAFRKVALGQTMGSDVKQTVRRFNFDTAAADPYNLATLDTLSLDDGAKAISILRAYARATAAAGTLGELAPQAFAATPADAQIAVAPNGDIVVLAASRYTDVDVEYIAARGDVVEVVLPVAANVATLPASWTTPGVLMVTEVEALVGTSIGKKIVLVPGAGAPAAGQARLNLAKTTVTFPAADAVTSCRVRAMISAAIELKKVLESTTDELSP